ncbi:unnamed protein product [Linum trigynum]|uniref:RNase H type-1 domain-containing protein n=1 Tax=Linum trigynum TaxID=586398 RepID=A0AAV2FWZ1_9ROSI
MGGVAGGGAPQLRRPVVQQPGLSSPAVGIVCQWDGATRKGSHSAGGWVLLAPTGDVLLASGVQFPGIDESAVVELFVLREAILWCLGHGFTEVGFEVDAKVIIDKINQADIRDNQLGVVLEEVLQVVGGTSGFSV